jgi:hypothetical protein
MSDQNFARGGLLGENGGARTCRSRQTWPTAVHTAREIKIGPAMRKDCDDPKTTYPIVNGDPSVGGGRGSNVFDLDCSRLCILIDGIQSMLRNGFATCNGGSPHFDRPVDRIVKGGRIVLTVFQLVSHNFSGLPRLLPLALPVSRLTIAPLLLLRRDLH